MYTLCMQFKLKLVMIQNHIFKPIRVVCRVRVQCRVTRKTVTIALCSYLIVQVGRSNCSICLRAHNARNRNWCS